MAYRADENLPEVVPDSSPQPLTYTQEYERRGLDQGDAKYSVIYDSQTPKILTSESVAADGGTPTSPAPAYRPPVEGVAAVGAGAAGAAAGVAAGVAAPPDDAGATSGATADRDAAADPVSPVTDDPGRSEAGLGGEKGGKGEPKILGLKKRTFWIVLIVAIIILAAAAIGGGVGGSKVSKKFKGGANSEGADEPEVETSTPSPTESSPSSTTDSGASASSTDDGEDDDDNENDTVFDAGFDLRAWEDANYKGEATKAITKPGFLDLPFNATSYIWKPNGTDCCVTFCQGEKKSVGWRCSFFERDESTAVFGRVFIGCGVEGLQENSRCS